MRWILVRMLVAALAVAVGGWAGYAWSGDGSAGAAVLGAACAGALAVGLDSMRGWRLLHWLRGDLRRDAPRDAALWGEVSYRMERALRARERDAEDGRFKLALFMKAIEASPNGVLLLDAHHQIEWCNAVAAAHFALDPERDRGQPATNLIRAPAFVSYLQSARFDTGVVFSNPRSSGTLSVVVRPYAEGQLLVMSQDITERELAEAMRRDFVANVSHEIRTPLTVLAGFVETMATLTLTDVERQRVLTLMQQQTQRMQTLVGDLLTLAQLEGSPRPATDRWVALDGLLVRIEGDARALSCGRHQFGFDDASGIEIAGAESELFSAIGNVVSNAVRYTPEGGSVRVRAAVREDGRCVVEVRDSGIGIASEHVPRLVERFYRVDTSRSRDTGGTGLGLSIVKHVMQRHGGELEVESDLGRGSCFRLILPAVRVRRAAAPQPLAQRQAA